MSLTTTSNAQKTPSGEAFPQPPRALNHEGQPRRVGCELELAGLEVEQVAALVRQLFGGSISAESRFLHTVTSTCLGTFTVELDSALLTEKRYEQALEGLGIELSGVLAPQNLENAIADLAKGLVPCEVSCPPVRIDQLPEIEDLRAALHGAQARGTRTSILHAFGFQLNVEVPAISVSCLLSYLRAFLLLCDWIKERQGIDLTRRLSPFIDSFPDAYHRLVLDPGYTPPDLQTLITDYLHHNPTRNRPLDLLPLLRFIDEPLVLAATEDPHLIKARPTFHYRLPDCRVDDPAWRLADEWQTWLAVERLAGNEILLQRLSEARLARPPFPLDLLQRSWADEVDGLLSLDHG